MKPMLQPVFAAGAIALLLTMPAAPLQAGPGAPARAVAVGAAWSHAGPEAILVHDRWGPRHDRWRPRRDRWRGRHGYPPRWRHRHWHRTYPHRATPYWSFTYPIACFAAKPWPRGHWRNHRHRHVRCHGGFTVVLPLSYPPRHYR